MKLFKSFVCSSLLLGSFSLQADSYLNWQKNPDAAKTPNKVDSKVDPNAPKKEHFKVDLLSPELSEPMEFCMLPTGKILICERTGALKEYDLETKQTRLVFELNCVQNPKKSYATENGFIGIAADPNFAENNYLYFYYSVPSKHLPEVLEENKLPGPKTMLKPMPLKN